MIPGKLLTERPAAEVEGGVEAVRREGVPPDVHAAVVGPAVESGAATLGRLQHVGQPAVAAGEDAFEVRELGIMPAELDLVAGGAPPPEGPPRAGPPPPPPARA